MPSAKHTSTITRHICPRNCFDTCSMIAYTENGILKKVDGDPKHGYTAGKLCTKGYSYINRVYHPDRLKTPMIQTHRGSGRWKEISWEQAMTIIAEKILTLYDRYDSHLSLALNKYSGNFGLLHNAAEGMFNSLGATTQTTGSPCWSAGLDAHIYDFGNYLTSDPEQISESKLLLLWGVNPAWTAIHSMRYIYQAQNNGATVITIDPIYTTSAKKSDIYIQLQPGSDLYLALAIAKVICANGWQQQAFLETYTLGWEAYIDSLNDLTLESLAERCGQPISVIETLAKLISQEKPMMIWTGFGLQRHVKGGQTIRAINALAALTGNIGVPGGGTHFAQQRTWNFNNYTSMNSNPSATRYININQFTDAIKHLDDPPIKFLWISCRNLLTQSPEKHALIKQLEKLELIVTVDQFMTPTAQQSDIVLPTTTQFEEWDVMPSYWHHWISINQPAIAPYCDCKSELQIAQLLMTTLNTMRPNTSNFPTQLSATDFIDREFNSELYEQLGITNWRELLDGPRKISLPTAWSDLHFDTPSTKFEFVSQRASDHQLPAMASLLTDSAETHDKRYPYWLLTPHSQFGLNSQFHNLPWIQKLGAEPTICIHPTTAKQEGLTTGTIIRLYNEYGSFIVKATLTHDVPPKVLVYYQGWYPQSNICINELIPCNQADMGAQATGFAGMAFYNAFVNIQKL